MKTVEGGREPIKVGKHCPIAPLRGCVLSRPVCKS